MYGRIWMMRRRIHAVAVLETGVCRIFWTGVLARSAGDLIRVAKQPQARVHKEVEIGSLHSTVISLELTVTTRTAKIPKANRAFMIAVDEVEIPD
jgi:hypothetical protein